MKLSKRPLLLSLAWSLLFPAAAVALPSAAERTDTVDAALVLSEVSVTAIKQATSLLRQPVTVTILDSAAVDQFDIAGMQDVSAMAPNYYMPSYGSPMTASIYVRGIGARIDQPAVGLNVDNIPFLNKNSYDFDMADVERIEVLRGPQSTLYGRNTIAGLINIYTLSPMRFQGLRLLAEGGSYAIGRISAGVYLKPRENFGTSISLFSSHTNGYQHNRLNEARCGELSDVAGRWRVVWNPSDAVSVENTLSATHARQKGYPYVLEGNDHPHYNDTCFYHRTGFTEGLTVKWNGPGFTMASITGLQMLHDNMTLDQDFTPQSLFTLSQRIHEWSLTEDVVFRGTKGKYSWLAGAFAFYKHGRMSAPVTFGQDGIDRLILGNINPVLPAGMELRWDEPEFVLGSAFRNPSRGVAVYHRSSVMLGPWELAAGLRYDYEHANLSYDSRVNTSATMYMRGRPMGSKEIDIDDHGRLSKTFSRLLPSVSATFNHRNSAFFASISKGYKAGGFNTQMFSTILQDKMMQVMGQAPDIDVDKIVSYKPETSWNYEVGGHFSVDRGRVYATFAAFWIDLRDQQVTVFPDAETTGRMMANAGRTRSYGAELTLRYAPTPRWTFNVAYGYNHATFSHFNDGHKDLSGNRVPFAPSNTLFASATWLIPVRGGWEVRLTPEVRGVGSIYWDEENLYRQPFYAQAAFTAGIHNPVWSVEVWMKNITDTRFNVFRFESVGKSYFQSGDRARFGVSLRIRMPDFKIS
ncbi:MAG: TonB-dependent receptor [Duncaniella sp.]|nr:TonB-dependent receptor [Duncaniella sp.]